MPLVYGHVTVKHFLQEVAREVTVSGGTMSIMNAAFSDKLEYVAEISSKPSRGSKEAESHRDLELHAG